MARCQEIVISRTDRPAKAVNTGRGDRIRTCCHPAEHQQLTPPDAPQDALAEGSLNDLAEVVAVWPQLSAPLKAAVLALVRTAADRDAKRA